MPGLNIKFTDAELARLRERARTEGRSMTTIVHDSAIKCGTEAEEDDLIWATYQRIKAASAELLRRLADK
jgi:hypothetical protein